MATGDYHNPVLLGESIHALSVVPGGIYVDCTFGGGGHASAILQLLDQRGRLIAFDQDRDALQNKPDDEKLLQIHQNFSHIQRYLRLHGIETEKRFLADLSLSHTLLD